MNPEFIKKNPTLASIVLFIFLFVIIVSSKPTFLYKADGSLRPFGIGMKSKTIFPIWLMSIVLGILCYLFILYYLHLPPLF